MPECTKMYSLRYLCIILHKYARMYQNVLSLVLVYNYTHKYARMYQNVLSEVLVYNYPQVCQNVPKCTLWRVEFVDADRRALEFSAMGMSLAHSSTAWLSLIREELSFDGRLSGRVQ